MAKQDFSEKFKDLQDKVKTSPVIPNIQKVVPVAKKATRKKIIDPENDTPFTFWTTNDRLENVKMRAIKDKTSAKELINKAIDLYLNT